MANRSSSVEEHKGHEPPEPCGEETIYQNTYWTERCFGLTAETLVDKAKKLDHVGGTHGCNRNPTLFMCLVMKMLQIQPDKEIVVEFIKNSKYVRVLGAFYLLSDGQLNP